ncbi:MAG TPA: RMD1 family protein [Polyangiaceae bacterium]
MPETFVPVRAFAFSATVHPKTLADLFPPSVERVRVTKTIAVLRYAAREWVVVHDFGAVVFMGVEPAECKRMSEAVLANVGEGPKAKFEETFAIQVAPEEKPGVRFDRAVVPDLDTRTAVIVSLGVAQSVAMEYYESDLDALVAELQKRSKLLATEGRLRGSARALMRFIGEGMTMHSEIVHTLSLLESPGITWEDEAFDRLYRELRAIFEIEERYRALDHELRIVQDNLALMVDMARQRRFEFLEIIVAVFVAMETLLFIGQLLLQRR